MSYFKTAGIMAAIVAVMAFMAATTAGAQEGDLNCGDPGTSHNMTVPPDDPHGLDTDNDGIGCEDPTVFEGNPNTTAPPEPPAAPVEPAEPAPGDDAEPAAPAEPVVTEPQFTG